MHIFWWVNRTHIHNIMHAEVNYTEFNTVYISITSPYYSVHELRFHNTYIFVRYFSLEVCCMSFWIFLLVAKGPVFISFLLRHDRSKQTEEWKLQSARKCFTRKRHTKRRKMNQALQLAWFFKMQKLICCGTTQDTAGYWQALSLPLDACTHRHENYHFIVLFYLLCWGVMISSWA